jgi:iron complex transport system ATP-binding protein
LSCADNQNGGNAGQDNRAGRLRARLLMFGRYPYHQGQPTADDQQKVLEIIQAI